MTKEYVKNYNKQINEINSHLSEIEQIVNTLPETASFTKSLKTTVVNFNKKVSGFLETGNPLTDEQRRAIAGIKSGKIPLSALSPYMEASSAGGNDEKPTVKQSAKKKR